MKGKKKDSDRAHIDRELEDMMDNDWRVFRAKLVLQEKAQEGEETMSVVDNRMVREESSSSSSRESLFHKAAMKWRNRHSSPIFVNDDDIRPFVPEENGYSIRQEYHPDPSSFTGHPSHIDQPFVIGDGNRDTDAWLRSSLHQHATRGGGDSIQSGSLVNEILEHTEDPFISESELPSLLKPKVNMDKRRWAHEIPYVEQGCVLVASEKLGSVFHEAVILVVQHNDRTGSVGVVINKPMNGDLENIALNQPVDLDPDVKNAFRTASVTYGGPAVGERSTILHGYGEVEGATKVCSGVFVGGAEGLMDAIQKDRFDPRNALFCMGMAGWGPEQLSEQIGDGVWYTAAISSEFILRYAADPRAIDNETHRDLWFDILNCMGGKYAEIAHRNRGGSRMDNRLMP